jgi:hypothetical protein
MSQSLGQQLVIENIGGAGGMIARRASARAAPDGYTILMHQVALAAGMTLYKNLSFDAEKDFVPSASSTPPLRPGRRADAAAEQHRRAGELDEEPGQNAKVAHAGVGSFGHLAGVLVAQELGATVTQVPYRGAGPALNDLLAGEVDLSSQSAVQSGPLVKAGKLKAYAIIGPSRFAGLPDLPTMGRAWLQEARSRFLAHAARARRHAAPDHRSLERGAAPRAGRAKVSKDLCRRRHGSVSAWTGNTRSGRRIAEERDQAVGRRYPGQQHHGDAVGAVGS